MQSISSPSKSQPIDQTSIEKWEVGQHYRYFESLPKTQFIVLLLEKSRDDWGIKLQVQILYEFNYKTKKLIKQNGAEKFEASYQHGFYGNRYCWSMDKVDLESIVKTSKRKPVLGPDPLFDKWKVGHFYRYQAWFPSFH